MRAEEAGLTNLVVLRGDAVALLTEKVPEASLAGIRIFFPDPWPKRRHHKRRLVQPAFLALAASRLWPGGTLHMATDWADYADQMRAVADAEPPFVGRRGAASTVAAGDQVRGACPGRGPRRPRFRLPQATLRSRRVAG